MAVFQFWYPKAILWLWVVWNLQKIVFLWTWCLPLSGLKNFSTGYQHPLLVFVDLRMIISIFQSKQGHLATRQTTNVSWRPFFKFDTHSEAIFGSEWVEILKNCVFCKRDVVFEGSEKFSTAAREHPLLVFVDLPIIISIFQSKQKHRTTCQTYFITTNVS